MSSDCNNIYVFGDFRLDVLEHRLERVDGTAAGPLPEKAFVTLAVLVENPGRLLTKQELLDRVWPDSFVEPNNVDKCIYAIRNVLGEKPGEQRYVETVRKHGYRFVAEVQKATEGPDQADLREAPTPTGRPESRPTPRRSALVLTGLIGAIVIAAVAASRYWPAAKPETARPVPVQKRLTTEGGATRAAVSRDGRFAAVVQNAALVLYGLEDGQKTLLVPAQPNTRITTTAITPDNHFVYYGTRPDNGAVVTLFKRSAHPGGEAEQILSDIYGSISFSPDARRMAFVRRYPELNEFALLTADADGKNIAKLASIAPPNRFEGAPAWSPDGRIVAVPAITVEGGFHHTIALVRVDSGEVKFVPGQRWAALAALSWLADSRTIVISAQADDASDLQIWRVDTVAGGTSRVTDDRFTYETMSASPDGRSIVAIKVRQSSHVWLLGGGREQLTSGFDNRDGAHGLGWLPDGRILYHSVASGRDAIWQMNADGSGASHVVDDAEGGFAVSRDGKWLAFQAKQQTDHLGLNAINLIDGTIREVTRGVTAGYPSFFPDGKRIAFSQYADKLTLQETTIDGGTPIPLSQEFRSVHIPAVSPSGRLVAFGFQRAKSDGLESGIAIFDDETKRIIATHPVELPIGGRFEEPTVGWSSDESEVYFIQLGKNSVSNVMRLRLADGAVSNVTNFEDGRIFDFAVEPGGTRMLIARGLVEREADLIRIAE